MGEEHGHAHSHEEHSQGAQESKRGTMVLYGLLALRVTAMAYNPCVIGDISSQMSTMSVVISTRAAAPASASVPVSVGTSGPSASLDSLSAKVLPSGVPKTYGSELKVSYDQPVQSLPILAKLDDSISLESLGTAGKER